MLPLVTGNTAGDPKRGLTQLLCSLSNLIGGIINLSQGMISCILTQSSLITCLFAEWALLVVRVVSLVKLTDRRQSKWNSAKYGEKHYILRKRSQMCKDKWKNGGRQCHYRKKKKNLLRLQHSILKINLGRQHCIACCSNPSLYPCTKMRNDFQRRASTSTHWVCVHLSLCAVWYFPCYMTCMLGHVSFWFTRQHCISSVKMLRILQCRISILMLYFQIFVSYSQNQ